MSEHRVILLEFNELTPALLDRFFAEGRLPNFRRFYEESSVYVTDAEASGELLNPWVQWVTVHTGLGAEEHGLRELNEGHVLKTPRVWDLASRAGLQVFVCGSMNVAHDDDLRGVVIPDPWSTNVTPHPTGQSLEHFYRFVQMQVQEHTNESIPLDKGDYARFLRFMLGNGMSMHTVAAIVKQLAQEKLGAAGRWKRAVLLDKLQFDVFRSVFRRRRPHFSTFFLNSTAHMQHAYWRNMDPGSFKIKPDEEDQREHGGAVLFGYEQMDNLLGRIMHLAGTDVTVVFATALGQQPYLSLEDEGGKHFYRPRTFDNLTRFAGIVAPHKCAPVMSEQFRIVFERDGEAEAAVPLLRGLRVGDRQVLDVRPDGPRAVFAGCRIYSDLADDVVMTSAAGEDTLFYDVFYSPHTLKSGMHHPDGALWIRTPARSHSVHDGRVPLRAVAPTLMRLLGLEPAEFMNAEPLQGAAPLAVS